MLHKFINSILEPMLDGSGWLYFITSIVAIVVILVAAAIVYFIVKQIIKIVTAQLVKTERSVFFNVIASNNILTLIAHLVAGIVLWVGSQLIYAHNNEYSNYESIILAKVALLYIFLICLIMISRLIWSLNSYYKKKFAFARQYPIYSYLKVVILFVWVVGVVLIVSFFMHTSPWALLTGVGAVSAVFLLVFKDTLLGIISSIQATALNIVHIGDRVVLDKFGVDGRVLDISINTVKVINVDNIISHIPTYMLTTEVIKTWRVIEDSNSRNMKRAVYLDPNSVVACDSKLLEQVQHLDIIRQYTISNPQTEFINLTLFRVFLQDYLNHHKFINHKELTLVRHLDPITIGILPIEIFAYITTADFAKFEEIQADIFEHVFSMLPLFNLKVYRQN